MSERSVEVLETKLDILIADFQSFKKYVIGFMTVIVLPFLAYMINAVIQNSQEIAIIKATIGN